MTAATKSRLEVKCRPILFSGSMVRAILAGTKTQTRRAIKTNDVRDHRAFAVPAYVTSRDVIERGNVIGHRDVIVPCPHGQPGDSLWCRETFAIESSREIGVADYEPPHKDGRPVRRVQCESWGDYWEQPHYRATDPAPELAYEDREPGVKWTPSIFMPRWASRITLEITEVRVERLQDISEEDARAEGVERTTSVGPCRAMGWRGASGLPSQMRATAAYRDLWESIHGPGSWELNPFCWVIEFKRVSP